MPRLRRNGKPFEQLGRLQLLDDDSDGPALLDQPEPAPLPPAKVRQRQDDAPAVLHCLLQMDKSRPRHARVQPLEGHPRQPERLAPVPAIRGERGIHPARKLRAGQPWAVGSLLMASHQVALPVHLRHES